MKYLLDTHTLLWAMTTPALLSDKVKAIIENPETHLVAGAVSFWEISLKYGLGKLELGNITPDDCLDACMAMNIEILPLDAQTCASYHQLEATYHRDPFDRMLLWLAKMHRFTLLSKDEMMKRYTAAGIRVEW